MHLKWDFILILALASNHLSVCLYKHGRTLYVSLMLFASTEKLEKG